mmetsp:Transcript_8907/g.16395  ORF Transcript_8907/g.16395 Transcript_8907/m.16395 type:complete len:146 (-) Transcript_8907:6-443(-)
MTMTTLTATILFYTTTTITMTAMAIAQRAATTTPYYSTTTTMTMATIPQIHLTSGKGRTSTAFAPAYSFAASTPSARHTFILLAAAHNHNSDNGKAQQAIIMIIIISTLPKITTSTKHAESRNSPFSPSTIAYNPTNDESYAAPS